MSRVSGNHTVANISVASRIQRPDLASDVLYTQCMACVLLAAVMQGKIQDILYRSYQLDDTKC